MLQTKERNLKDMNSFIIVAGIIVSIPWVAFSLYRDFAIEKKINKGMNPKEARDMYKVNLKNIKKLRRKNKHEDIEDRTVSEM